MLTWLCPYFQRQHPDVEDQQTYKNQMWRTRTHHEWQRQAAEGELFDVGLGDGAAGIDLVAGIILAARREMINQQ